MGRRRRDKLGIDYVGGLKEESTAFAGVGLLADVYRQAGIGATAEKVLPQKRSPKGLSQGQMVEIFAILSSLGGGCLEDMERLRQDEGLAALLEYTPPAAETARQWLDGFHDESLMIDKPLQGSFIPQESAPLAGLGEVNKRVIWAYVRAKDPAWEITLDVDAHLVETAKADAQCCYEGYKAFQPIEVVWAQTMLVLADEFRAGNVPASKDIKRLVDEAYEALPPGPWQVKVRSDSAAYEQDVLDHWNDRGWGFAVSADMTPQLRAEIETLPVEAWKVWKTEKGGVVREWAEVVFVPSRRSEKRATQPYRYLAIRIRRQQGELFADGVAVRHFALVSNIWDMDGQALLGWHRGKAGTVEHVHHNLVNELGAGVYPSGKHGANAAWLRLQVITHNLLQVLKAVALPPEYANARPKRLRFAVFTHIGQVVRHGGRLLMRIAKRILEEIIRPGRRRVLVMTWDTG
jgi:hypothetical protein